MRPREEGTLVIYPLLFTKRPWESFEGFVCACFCFLKRMNRNIFSAFLSGFSCLRWGDLMLYSYSTALNQFCKSQWLSIQFISTFRVSNLSVIWIDHVNMCGFQISVCLSEGRHTNHLIFQATMEAPSRVYWKKSWSAFKVPSWL